MFKTKGRGLRQLAMVVLALVGTGTATRAATAQGSVEVDDQTRLVARDLAGQGAEAFQAGKLEEALGLFQRAQALVNAPTISIFVARSLQRLGRWVEAAEEFRRCAAHPVDDASPPPFADATRDAKAELDALLPQIPRISIVTQPTTKEDSSIRVIMDGSPLAPAMIGVEFPVNPGGHDVSATNSAGAKASELIDSIAGRSNRITLRLVLPSSKAAARNSAPVHLSTPAPAVDTTGGGGTQRLLGYVALGVGGASLAVGVITGSMATSRHSEASRECPDFKCFEGTAGADAVRGFRTLSTVSTVAYVAGAVSLATGGVLLLTAPSGKPKRAQVAPYLGLASAGVAGSF